MQAKELRILISRIPDDAEIYVPPMNNTGGWVSNEVMLQPITGGCGDTSIECWLLLSPDKLDSDNINVSVDEIRH